MKLNRNQWVAVVVSVCVVGFFFVFGQKVLSVVNSTKSMNSGSASNLGVQDVLIGGGQVAMPGSRVTVHYTGRLTDGRVFDSSVSRNEPFQFTLGTGQVIPGWEQGIEGMREGGKRILTVPPHLGYGLSDYGPIPGGSTLIFEVELLKVENQ